MRLIVTGEW